MTSYDIEFSQVTVDDVTLAVSIHPSRVNQQQRGIWMVVAHGFTGHRMGPGFLYVKMCRRLAEIGVNSLRFDFSGAGESSGLFQDMTLSTMNRDMQAIIHDVRSQHAPRKLVLFGHSFGGCVAALAAGSHQADGLLLCAPVARPERLVERHISRLSIGGTHGASGLYAYGPHLMHKKFLDELRTVNPLAVFDAGFRGPLLLFQGDADQSVSVEESHEYVRYARRGGCPTAGHVLSGADHNFSRVEDVTFLITTIEQWFKENFL